MKQYSEIVAGVSKLIEAHHEQLIDWHEDWLKDDVRMSFEPPDVAEWVHANQKGLIKELSFLFEQLSHE